MDKRETTLRRVLEDKFGKGLHKKPTTFDFVNSRFNNDITSCYKNLGGILTQYPTRFRGYDIVLKDFIVELDEERHFNRYRNITLKSGVYKDIPMDIDLYDNFCVTHEDDCLKSANWGKNWTSKSSEAQFGMSANPGIFDGNGSSRWKQRAFYDYLRDVGQTITFIPLIRIPIWETTDNYTINDLLRHNRFEPLISSVVSKLK